VYPVPFSNSDDETPIRGKIQVSAWGGNSNDDDGVRRLTDGNGAKVMVRGMFAWEVVMIA